MKKYYYVYYSYEEFGRGYIGKRECKCLPEEDIKYFGSFRDKTFKPTQKIVLEIYDTLEEALQAEVVLHDFYQVDKNPHFANKARQTSNKFYYKLSSEESKKLCVGFYAIPKKERVVYSSKGGNQSKKLGVGIHGLTKEERSDAGKKGSKKCRELCVGIYSLSNQQLSKNGKMGGQKAKELGVGIHGRSKEQMIEDRKMGGQKVKELGVGVHSLSKEERIKNASKAGKMGNLITNSQKWICLETGFISSSGPLTNYQRSRGIDTSKRKKLE